MAGVDCHCRRSHTGWAKGRVLACDASGALDRYLQSRKHSAVCMYCTDYIAMLQCTIVPLFGSAIADGRSGTVNRKGWGFNELHGVGNSNRL